VHVRRNRHHPEAVVVVPVVRIEPVAVRRAGPYGGLLFHEPPRGARRLFGPDPLGHRMAKAAIFAATTGFALDPQGVKGKRTKSKG